MAKIEVYGVGQGSVKKLESLAKKKDDALSLSEYCKHVLLDHLKVVEEQKK
jgi:hypothetical protein